MDSLSVIDLFSGAGGFSLGAHLAGFETVLAIDKDEDLSSSYNINFPKTTLLNEDLSTYSAEEALEAIDKKPGEVTGLIGGPPCQGFSIIGHRDPEDPRNDLVGHFFDFVKGVQPAFFVMENVPNILKDPFKPILEKGLRKVRGAYEIVEPMLVDASRFGAATARLRMIVIGYDPQRMEALTEENIRTLESASNKRSVYQAIHDLPAPTSALTDETGHCWAEYASPPDRGKQGQYARAARATPPRGLSNIAVRRQLRRGLVSGFQPTAHTETVEKRYRTLAQGGVDKTSKARRLTWDDPCTTLRAGTGADRGSYQAVRPIHPSEARVISVREAARIQGFPDWFQFHNTIWHSFRMIGNSVSPNLSKALLSLVSERLLAPVG